MTMSSRNFKRLIAAGCMLLTSMMATAQVTYTRQDSAAVVDILRSSDASTLSIARRFLKVPYVAHTLEVNKEEQLVVNLHELDCTTFVETVLALKRCIEAKQKTFDDYCKALQKIRYEGGAEPDYRKRLHYFTLWMDDNERMGVVKSVETPNPPYTAIQKVNVDYMTTHVNSYKMLKEHPAWKPAIRALEQKINGKKYRYIPKSQIKNTKLLRQCVHDGDIISILTNIKGLDTQHIGFAVWHKDGLHLLNASSIHKKVVEEPMTLRQYLGKHKTMTGIRVCRP